MIAVPSAHLYRQVPLSLNFVNVIFVLYFILSMVFLPTSRYLIDWVLDFVRVPQITCLGTWTYVTMDWVLPLRPGHYLTVITVND